MNVVGIIPARYGSSRLPGKPLADICGKPMLLRVYERVIQVKKFSNVYVATDDARIEELCRIHRIPVVMTKSSHRTAAHRLQEVSESINADFYVQLNGDEPLISIEAIEACIPDTVPQDIEFGTNVISPLTNPTHVMDPSNIKMVFDSEFRACYMSRTPIPYPFKAIDFIYYKHVGIIGYNKKMLDFYKNSQPGRFERIEGIDTLRFIDYGKFLKLSIVENCNSLSVDTEKDLEFVRNIFQNIC